MNVLVVEEKANTDTQTQTHPNYGEDQKSRSGSSKNTLHPPQVKLLVKEKLRTNTSLSTCEEWEDCDKKNSKIKDMPSFASLSSCLLSPNVNEKDKFCFLNNSPMLQTNINRNLNQTLSTAVSLEVLEPALPLNRQRFDDEKAEGIDDIEKRINAYLEMLNVRMADPSEKRDEYMIKLRKRTLQMANNQMMEVISEKDSCTAFASSANANHEPVSFSMSNIGAIPEEEEEITGNGVKTCPYYLNEPQSFSLYLDRNKLRKKLFNRKKPGNDSEEGL